MFQIIKRINSRDKYKKWKKKQPKQETINYIGSDQNVSFEKSVVCFVNNSFSNEVIQMALVDSISLWFFKNSQTPEASDWFSRKGNPSIYAAKNDEDMEVIVDMHKGIKRLEVSEFAGHKVAICLGPMWTNELMMYNNTYNKINF